MAGERDNDREVWLTVPQLATQWPFSESTIRRWIDSGELPGVQGRGRYGRRKVRQADAEAFKANGYQRVVRPDS